MDTFLGIRPGRDKSMEKKGWMKTTRQTFVSLFALYDRVRQTTIVYIIHPNNPIMVKKSNAILIQSINIMWAGEGWG